MNKRFGVSAVLVLLLAGNGVRGQETVNYASVRGQVTDPQGAVVPGAIVSARQTETNVSAEIASDGEGRFRFPYLKVGPYEIRVHLDGFTDASQTLTLTLGAAFDLTIPLKVAGIDANVVVTGTLPVL